MLASTAPIQPKCRQDLGSPSQTHQWRLVSASEWGIGACLRIGGTDIAGATEVLSAGFGGSSRKSPHEAILKRGCGCCCWLAGTKPCLPDNSVGF